jgi:hypothetical protein
MGAIAPVAGNFGKTEPSVPLSPHVRDYVDCTVDDPMDEGSDGKGEISFLPPPLSASLAPALLQRARAAPPPILAPFVPIVESAIMALHNNQILVTGPNGRVVPTFPSELVLMLKGLIGAGKVYRFQLNETSSGTGLTTGGGGSMDQAYAWSPNVRTYGEWSALAALFDQVKLHSVKLSLVSTFSGSSTSATVATMIAPDYNNSAVVPSGGLVSRLPGVKFLSVMHTSAYVLHANVDRAQPWRVYALTSSPDASGPIGGTNGQWSVSSLATGAASLKYFETKQHLICSFMNRA